MVDLCTAHTVGKFLLHTSVYCCLLCVEKRTILGPATMRDLYAVKSYRLNCCRPNHMMPVSLGLTAVSSYRAIGGTLG